MTGQEPDWHLLRTFLAVMREGSLSGAARRLGLTQPTIGRQIAELEAALGVSLFTRSPRGLIPTASSRELLPFTESMASASAALLRTASGSGSVARGTVRLTASEIMGCEVLPPILADFQRKHPKIELELTLNNRNENLLRRDADIAVRMARPTQKMLVARKIGHSGIGLYAHRDYVLQHGTPRSLADLEAHCLIGFDRDDWSFRSAGPQAGRLGREQFGFRCDSDPARFAALKAGTGIGGCQDLIAGRLPELVPILPDLVRFSLDVWLAMHRDLKETLRVRLLFDHLAQQLKSFLQGKPQ